MFAVPSDFARPAPAAECFQQPALPQALKISAREKLPQPGLVLQLDRIALGPSSQLVTKENGTRTTTNQSQAAVKSNSLSGACSEVNGHVNTGQSSNLNTSLQDDTHTHARLENN